MPATLLEILDSAVKIGLGALISGGAAFLVMRHNHAHDRRKAALEDKRSLLRSTAKLLEEASAAVNLGTYAHEHDKANRGAGAKSLVDAVNKLTEARSLAMLSGERELQERLARLRGAAEQLAGYYLEAGDAYSIADANRLLVGVSDCWAPVHAALESAYKRLAGDA
jgi:hypothetical protein